MNALLQALGDTCKAERYVQKILVVKSYHDGHQILKALARCGTAWLNVTPITPDDLAINTAEAALKAESIRLADDGEILYLISKVLDEMRSNGELKYFSALEGIEGPEGILKAALLELRMAGVTAASLDIAAFVDHQKGIEIKRMLAGFEEILLQEKLADSAALYIKATEILKKAANQADDFIYLIPEQLEFDHLTFEYLQLLTTGKRTVLPAEAVCGLSRPDGHYFKVDTEPTPESQICWLYAQNDPQLQAAPLPAISFFQAYSPTCEIKEVFRRLIKDQVKADEAMLCYANSETYLPLIHSAAQTLGIPVTYAEGLPAGFTRPGRLLAGLLDWIEDSYSAIHIYRLLCSGALKASWSNLQAELLRRAAVGWGRERYPACLGSLKQEIEDGLRKAEAKGWSTHYSSAKLEHFPKLEELITTLFTRIPVENPDGTVQFDLLCRGLSEIMKKYAPTADELERSARESILEMLGQLAVSKPEATEYRAALKRLRKRFNALRVGAAPAEAGHLHAAPLSGAEWSERKNCYLIGLAGNYFPGSGLQDAVLLDRERENISLHLLLCAPAPERNLYRLNHFLAARRGPLSLSFSCFEPVEGRPAFPAAVLLQAYRLQSGKPEADYGDFFNSLEPPAAYYPVRPDQALALNEWWLSQVLGGHKQGELQSVTDCYPGIKAGLEAEAKRRSSTFTEYDGKVQVDPNQVDPRLNNNKSLSASAIEKLAGCPYAYFLKNMLNVKPPEEQAFERWAWLGVMERGTLLHAVYARYLRAVCSKPGSPREDRSELFNIAEDEIANKKKDSPPPSEVVFQSERNALLRELETFLKCEEQLWQEGSIPAYMEAPFGRGATAVQEAGIGREDAIEYQLPGKDKILIRGNIDRIDRLPEPDHFRVWDFKTGGTYSYKSSTYIKQGRQIQHALYASAAETILRDHYPNAVVEEAGYLFPTEKGEGEAYLRKQNQRDKVKEAVELMLKLLSTGTFCVAEKGDDSPCKFCDYPAICRHPQALEDLQKKKDDPANTILDLWKELQNYA
jgi:RecB family exonuclease